MKKLPEEYWALFRLIHQRTVPSLLKDLPADLLNPVFGLPPSNKGPKRQQLSRNERYWIDWLQEFSEINSSIERLDQCLVYLTHFPAKKSFRFHGLSESDWLRYHIEAYLQETYILYTRLTRFLRMVEKVAIASSDKAGLLSAKGLKRIVEESFAAIVKTRAGHVHEHRFDATELRNLDTLVLLTKAGRLRKLYVLRQLEYFSALEKWRKQLIANNKEILTGLVLLFPEATKILKRNEPHPVPGSNHSAKVTQG